MCFLPSFVCFLCLIGTTALPGSQAIQENVTVKIERHSPHSYEAKINDFAGQKAIVTEDGLILIGCSGSPELSDRFMTALNEAAGTQKVKAVILTTNDVLSLADVSRFPEALFIAHRELRDNLMKNEKKVHELVAQRKRTFEKKIKDAGERLKKLDPASNEAKGWRDWAEFLDIIVRTMPNDFEIRLPDIVFEDKMELVFRDFVLKLTYIGRSDTPGGMVVSLPEEAVVFSNNLCNSNHLTPTLKNNPEGYDIPRWISVMEELISSSDDHLMVHTNMTGIWDQERLKAGYGYIKTLWEACEKASAEGKSFEQFLDSVRLEHAFPDVWKTVLHKESPDQWTRDEHARSVRVFWKQLHRSVCPLIERSLAEYGAAGAPAAVFGENLQKNPDFFIDENEINVLGYRKLNEQKREEAIAVFTINTLFFPESANAFDSLGEAYWANGDRKQAQQNYRKSLELNPDNQNARKMLEEKGPFEGKTPPGATPEIFAPGLISSGFDEKLIAVHPAGQEIYFTVAFNGYSAIVVTKKENGTWTFPEIAEFSGIYYDTEPSFHPDGSRFFFTSKRPVSDHLRGIPDNKLHKWYMDRIGDEWTVPKPLDAPVNGAWSTCGSSAAKNGNLYIALQTPEKKGIYLYRSKYKDGRYQELELLPECINQTFAQDYPCISPDESYLVFNAAGRSDLIGGKGQNLYVSFRDEKDRWSPAVNLGGKINTSRLGEGSSISPDGKSFFFQSRAHTDMELPMKSRPTYDDLKKIFFSGPNNSTFDIFWVSTQVITELRPSTF